MPNPLTRRRFLLTGAALPAAFSASARMRGSSWPQKWVLLGTGAANGIFRCTWDARTGALGAPERVAEANSPDFLAMHPHLPVLYSVNEGHGAQAGISAYRVDRATAALTPLNRRETHGDDPCFVSVDRTGTMAFTANYTGGSLTAFSLAEAGATAALAPGALLGTIGVFAYKQARTAVPDAPKPERQEAPHLHSATVSPDNRYVIACDLGDDVVLLFPIKAGLNASVAEPLRVAARPGSGPRHVAFHPHGRWVYCMHELDCTVDLFDWHAGGSATGDAAVPMTARPGSVVPLLEPGEALTGNTGAELAVSADGRFLYTCTRGVNMLSVFRIDSATGLLHREQRVSCGGVTPRFFALDPSERWLVCCNQGDGTVVTFARDPSTGRLGEAPRITKAEAAMFVLWL